MIFFRFFFAAIAALLPIRQAGSTTWMKIEREGGNATVYSYGASAYTHAIPGLSLPQRALFSKGAEEFNAVWQAPTAVKGGAAAHIGLGPAFNGTSCAQCHTRDGRALTFGGDEPISPVVLQISLPDGRTLPLPSQTLGSTPKDAADLVAWVTTEHTLPDMTKVELRRPQLASMKMQPNMTMLRTAPAVFGLGLLEAIDDVPLLRRAALQPWNKFGIAGKVRLVTGPTTRRARPGRFGWKGEHANLPDQVAHALLGEMGITSPWLMSARASNYGNPRSSEMPMKPFQQLVAYMRWLGVPARQVSLNEGVLRGAVLFEKAHCAMCHQPESLASHIPGTQATPKHRLPQKIYPFTDLLLHDLGEPLASGAGPWRRYWKTPALWGIGLQQQVAANAGFLHDGRARNLLEAILWHGGEAENSRSLFEKMSANDRQQLIQFLESL
jgi:CxxC motif-containing protein (DUF1111 family)